jgi:hypothetical protein
MWDSEQVSGRLRKSTFLWIRVVCRAEWKDAEAGVHIQTVLLPCCLGERICIRGEGAVGGESTVHEGCHDTEDAHSLFPPACIVCLESRWSSRSRCRDVLLKRTGSLTFSAAARGSSSTSSTSAEEAARRKYSYGVRGGMAAWRPEIFAVLALVAWRGRFAPCKWRKETGVVARLVAVACLASDLGSRPAWGSGRVPGTHGWESGLGWLASVFASRNRRMWDMAGCGSGRAIGIGRPREPPVQRTSCTYMYIAHIWLYLYVHEPTCSVTCSRAFPRRSLFS